MATDRVVVTFELSNKFTGVLAGLTGSLNTFTNKIKAANAAVGSGDDPGEGKAKGFLAGMINNSSVIIRRLARIRTAFFILLTVFAVRPIIRVFQELISKSVEVENRFADIDSIFNVLKGNTAKGMEDVFVKLKVAIEGAKLAFVDFALSNADAFGKLLKGLYSIYQMMVVLKDVAIATSSGVKLLFSDIDTRAAAQNIITIQNLLNNLIKGRQEMVKEFLGPEPFFYFGGKQGRLDSLSEALSDRTTLIESLTKQLDELHKKFDVIDKDNLKLRKDWEAGDQAAVGKAILQIGTQPPWLKNLVHSLDDVRKASIASGSGRKEYLAALGRGEDVEDIGVGIGEQFAYGFSQGFKERLGNIVIWATELGKDIQKAFKTGFSDTFFDLMEAKFSRLKDVLVNFFTSIKRAIADFLANQATKALITGIITPLATAATSYFIGGGNTYSSSGQTRGYGINYDASGNVIGSAQHGRVISRHGLYELGEGGMPEVVVPLKSGKIPVESIAGSGKRRGGGVTQVFNFSINAIDAQSGAQFIAAQKDRIKGIMLDAAVGGDMAIRNAYRLR